jgi:hypothetical protein
MMISYHVYANKKEASRETPFHESFTSLKGGGINNEIFNSIDREPKSAQESSALLVR